MAKVTDLSARRKVPTPRPNSSRFVTCRQCGERHPIVRLAKGELQCVTAFHDGAAWFCRNRGCRAEWLAAQQRR